MKDNYYLVLFVMTTLKIPEQKVILCGEYGVGKSSLFRRFTSNIYTTATDRQSTLGLDHYSKRYHVAGKDLKVSGYYNFNPCNQFIIWCLFFSLYSSNCGTLEEWRELPQSHQAIINLQMLQFLCFLWILLNHSTWFHSICWILCLTLRMPKSICVEINQTLNLLSK